MLKNKFFVTLLAAFLCVGGVLLFRTFKPDPEALLKKRVAERSLGDPKAGFWITEYYDYQCPPCGSARKLLDDVMKRFPGKIYLQVRYFPLPAHKNALSAAVHAECASRQPGHFWAFHEQLFEHQQEWAMDPYASLKFLNYAQSAGIDTPRWDACAKDPETEKYVLEEKKKGEALGIKITPSFFVNGKLVVGVNGLSDALKELEPKAAPSVEPQAPAAS